MLNTQNNPLLEIWLNTKHCEDCFPPWGVVIDWRGNGVPFVCGKRCFKHFEEEMERECLKK